MASTSKIKYLILFLFICNISIAQTKRYSTANAHSHNDYLSTSPFYLAYQNGFASIEADIFPVNGKLVVAHSKKEINIQHTLKKIYLDPMLRELSSDPARRIKLLVDIKDNYKESLDLLQRELIYLQSYISSPGLTNPLTILITGTRPPPSEYKNYPAYIFFDDDLKLSHKLDEWERVGQVSLAFSRFSKWKGEGKPDKQDIKKLKHTVDSVHKAGKTIRFWAAPDNLASWKVQKKLGVDLIGTDRIDDLGRFLRE